MITAMSTVVFEFVLGNLKNMYNLKYCQPF